MSALALRDQSKCEGMYKNVLLSTYHPPKDYVRLIKFYSSSKDWFTWECVLRKDPHGKNAAQISLRRSAQTETPPAIHLRMPAAAASTDPPALPFKEAKELAANARTSSDSGPPAQQLHAAAWLIPSIGRTATTHETRAQCSRRKKPLRNAVLRRAMRSSAVLWENLHRGEASMQVFRMIQV